VFGRRGGGSFCCGEEEEEEKVEVEVEVEGEEEEEEGMEVMLARGGRRGGFAVTLALTQGVVRFTVLLMAPLEEEEEEDGLAGPVEPLVVFAVGEEEKEEEAGDDDCAVALSEACSRGTLRGLADTATLRLDIRGMEAPGVLWCFRRRGKRRTNKQTGKQATNAQPRNSEASGMPRRGRVRGWSGVCCCERTREVWVCKPAARFPRYNPQK
jgi:hypothetical protein